MLPGDERIEQEVASSSRARMLEGEGGDDENEESKENQVVSSQSEGLASPQEVEQESRVNAKKLESDDDKRPSTTTPLAQNTPSTTTPNEEDEEDEDEEELETSERKSDEEPLAKRVRCESSDEESKKSLSNKSNTNNNNLTLEEFTDIVLASEGFENRAPSSVRVKPVVLAPRTNGNYHHQTVTSSASVVVSVKPRIQPPKRRYPPPSGRLPSGSSLVEEWFRKMKPPLVKEEHEEDAAIQSESAMNLSLKSKPITLRPNKGPSLSISSHPSYPKPPLSPPRLEIKKMSSDKLSGRYYPSLPSKKKNLSSLNKPSPQTDLVYSDMMDAIKDRAVRDLHLAHTKDMHGNFPIHMSVLMRKPSLVRRYCCVLHILNSNVDLTNDDKYTALHLAVLDNSVEIVELLLSFGADPSIRDHRGNTCFHQAVAMKSNECLKLLVEHLRTKEDLDSFNDSGFTALQIAIKKNDPASVHTLIQSGANLNIPENYKTTNCHLTPKNEHNKIISERYLSLSRLH